MEVHEKDQEKITKPVILLTVLYFLQGMILGIGYETIPLFLKEKMSFTDLSFFMLSQYPFSLKILWSPLIDTYYLNYLGKRKSWVILTQYIICGILIYLSYNINDLIEIKSNIFLLTSVFLLLIFMVCSQDIAVDGWALQLLGEKNCAVASSCQSIGQILGVFVTSALFLNLNNADFCKKYLFYTGDGPILTLSNLFIVVFVLFFIINSIVLFFVSENLNNPKLSDENQEKDFTLFETLSYVYQLTKNKNLMTYLFTIMISNFGRVFFNSFALILFSKGLSKQNYSIYSSLEIPIHIVFSVYFSKISSQNLLQQGLKAHFWINLTNIASLVFLHYFEFFNSNEVLLITSFLVLMIASNYFSMYYYSAHTSFFNKISDRSLGATYLTLLNSSSNLSMKLPGLLILPLIDYFGAMKVGIFSVIIMFFTNYFLKAKWVKLDNLEINEWKIVRKQDDKKKD